MALSVFTSEPEETNTIGIFTSLSSIPTTKTMTTTATPSPRQTIFSNSYSLQRDTTLSSSYSPYNPYRTSTRDFCTLYSSGSGLDSFSSLCNSVYGSSPTGGSIYTPSLYTPSTYDSPSYLSAHPFAIWKIVILGICGFLSLVFLIGGCFRLREKRRQRALDAAAATSSFPNRLPFVQKEVEQLPTYGQAVTGGQTAGVVPPTTTNENVIRPVERVHLRDEAGNVQPVGGPPVRNVWPGLR
jgi:hypothetical protein